MQVTVVVEFTCVVGAYRVFVRSLPSNNANMNRSPDDKFPRKFSGRYQHVVTVLYWIGKNAIYSNGEALRPPEYADVLAKKMPHETLCQ